MAESGRMSLSQQGVHNDDDRKLESLVRSSRHCRLYDRRRCAAVCQRTAANDVLDAPLETKRPNTGSLSLNFGVDWASAYYFRGIAQNRVERTSSPTVRCPSSSLKTLAPHRTDRDARHLNNWHAGGGTSSTPLTQNSGTSRTSTLHWRPRCGRTSP
jgi:hypothetical protein